VSAQRTEGVFHSVSSFPRSFPAPAGKVDSAQPKTDGVFIFIPSPAHQPFQTPFSRETGFVSDPYFVVGTSINSSGRNAPISTPPIRYDGGYENAPTVHQATNGTLHAIK